MMSLGILAAAGAGAILLTAAAAQADATAKPGIVSNINLVSDKVADVSSAEAWQKSYIKPGMSDREKAVAAWKSVVAHQHQNAPPSEFLNSDNAVVDPIKMFNVYGYSLCSVHASHVAAMARAAGLKARNQTIVRHCVAEVFFDDEWHMLDASLVNYFPKPDGKIASVDEIIAATGEFYKQHPDLKNNPEGLEKFWKDGGWKKGPPLLASCPFYKENGLLAADWPWQCGWPETMREYDGSTQFVFEPGYSMGYRVNVQLRQGERLTRNWGNKGLHVNMGWKKDSVPPPCIDAKVGEGSMSYSPAYGDLANGRIGNGVHEYEVPLASGAFRGGALSVENLVSLEAGASAALQNDDKLQAGVLRLRMPSSYVYLSGTVSLDLAPKSQVSVLVSTNNGLDWKEAGVIKDAGKQSIDLKPHIFGHYDYQVEIRLTGGLNGLSFRHDVQHSQRPLPALAQGDNTISFSAGNEGTVTVEGSTDVKNNDKQVVWTDYHPKTSKITEPKISIDGKEGWVEFPIKTPADMKRLRVFSFYRARSEQDSWKVTASFDGGKTYRDLGTMDGPFKAMEKKFVVSDIPAGAKEALVRFAGTQKDGALLFNVRLDADYDEPSGGFRPVKITYVWEENGIEKRDIHIAKTPADTWKITCATKPIMKSYSVELAD